VATAWIAWHVTVAVLVEVDGGHFGPRIEPEERLLSWAGGLDIEPRLATAHANA
jgi:hypothetical protein